MAQDTPSKKAPKIFATIYGIDFPTKKSLEEHIQGIVADSPKTPLSVFPLFGKNLRVDQVSFPPLEIENFVKELIETRYDNYDAKIGDRGLDRVFVAKNIDFPNTNCFYIIRKDGSFTDISWRACLNARNKHELVRRAFRTAIIPQILDFKDYIFNQDKEIRCPYTNEILTYHNCHIDHQAPRTFEAMYQEYLRCMNLNEDEILLTTSKDMNSTKEIADEKLREDWQKFHRHFCILRPLSQAGNLSYAKKDASTNPT